MVELKLPEQTKWCGFEFLVNLLSLLRWTLSTQDLQCRIPKKSNEAVKAVISCA